MRGFVIAGFALCLSACGPGDASQDKAETKGKGMARQDLSKIPAGALKDAGGIKPNADVLRTRRIVGRWSGAAGSTKVNVVFGSDGTASIEALRADGAVTAGGSGKYVWQPDDTLKGSFAGLGGELSGLSSWSGSFPTTHSIAMTGSGVTATISKGGF